VRNAACILKKPCDDASRVDGTAKRVCGAQRVERGDGDLHRTIVSDDFPVLHPSGVSLELPFADAARAAFFRAVFEVMAVFARSAGVASCACRCVRHAHKCERGYYGDDKRYRFHGF